MTTSTASTQTYDIHHDLIISAPASNVFNAITQPEHLVNWWPLQCSGKPEEGAEYNFYFEPEYNWYGKVSQVVLNKLFFIKMTKAEPDWNPTSFGFELQEYDKGVNLRFRHTGWPQCNAHFRRSSFCWALLLQGLKDYVEKGKVIPFEERA